MSDPTGNRLPLQDLTAWLNHQKLLSDPTGDSLPLQDLTAWLNDQKLLSDPTGDRLPLQDLTAWLNDQKLLSDLTGDRLPLQDLTTWLNDQKLFHATSCWKSLFDRLAASLNIEFNKWFSMFDLDQTRKILISSYIRNLGNLIYQQFLSAFHLHGEPLEYLRKKSNNSIMRKFHEMFKCTRQH